MVVTQHFFKLRTNYKRTGVSKNYLATNKFYITYLLCLEPLPGYCCPGNLSPSLPVLSHFENSVVDSHLVLFMKVQSL